MELVYFRNGKTTYFRFRYRIVSERIAPLLYSQACYCALRAPSQTAHISSSYPFR